MCLCVYKEDYCPVFQRIASIIMGEKNVFTMTFVLSGVLLVMIVYA